MLESFASTSLEASSHILLAVMRNVAIPGRRNHEEHESVSINSLLNAKRERKDSELLAFA